MDESCRLTTKASFVDDLGADSLDIVELAVMAFEEKPSNFWKSPTKTPRKIGTAGDAVNAYIENKKK